MMLDDDEYNISVENGNNQDDDDDDVVIGVALLLKVGRKQ